MRRWFRQGGAVAGQVSHHALRLIGTLALVGMLLIGAAAWRLGRGPVELPALASRIAAAATAAMPGSIVTIGQAGLAWEGFNRGGAPIDLRLSDIAIFGRHGAVAARLSRLRITLSPVLLLRGRIAPIEIIARQTAVVVRPAASPAVAAPAVPAGTAGIADAAAALGRLIGTFAQMPRAGGLDLAALRRISIARAHLALDDPARGLELSTDDARLALTRSAAGTLHGTARAVLRHGASTAPLVIDITGAAGLGRVKAVLGPVDPAMIAPRQADCARADLPVTLTVRWPIGPRAPARLDVTLRAGPGHVRAGGSVIAVSAITAALTATPRTATLAHARLTLAGLGDAPGPTARLSGTLGLTGAMTGRIAARVDHVTAAELAGDWPLALARGPRKYVVNHVIAGTARDGVFDARFTLAPPGRMVRLDRFSGGFAASGVTLKWFKHAVPMTGLAGTLRFIDQDILMIRATSGRLGGLDLIGRMIISSLGHHDQTSLVLAQLTGNAAAAVPLLDAPPLKLAARGIALAGVAGTLNAGIDVGIRLTKHVTLADVKLAARVRLGHLHLPLPVAGLALDRGQMVLNAALDRISMQGEGMLAGERARFHAAMALPDGDFTLKADTTAGHALLAKLGVETALWRSGAAPLAIVYRDARGRGMLDLAADLTPVALALPVAGWRKPAGAAGHAMLGLVLRHGRPRAVRTVDIGAPGLALRGETTGGALVISAARLGGTRATGKLTPPDRAGAPWVLALAGPTLDLSAALNAANPSHPAATGAPASKPPAPPALPWRLRAAFDRIRLDKAPAPALGGVHVDATGNAGTLTRMTAVVRTDPNHDARLEFGRQAGTDTVRLTAGDAGALFAAIGTTGDIARGRLVLNAVTRGATTTGEAVMTDFRLRHAPVIAKVLQGMSLYGVPAATSGPGLAITRLTAPFSITGPLVRLGSGRAYSASLGFTATGTIDVRRKRYDLSGTIVPAYALNALPGRIPLIGKLFSPEKGSGLFAARYSVVGPFADPHIAVNPLSALTPGFLREIFGMFNAPAATKP
ncbi:AsmA-like C-terminal region-containing protein [Acidiphilium sp. PA]|uniref:AsmA-like C-terminal region-containing protein n=1 Tax=Acidiphilium sp. PA TaxID=2871705 RepID=UPI0022430A05|nr:AsmA-like C-terminal region-containing protein [Acidiphilium sp. PA]MCW8307365.1 AsmA-like C-terminal region-containing protein [Acidiphilium sp. PA]